MKAVRTRFAPSPTGFQHIGGFRTALYAWLLARKNGGTFLLRIEDTDQERRVPGAIQYIVESLHWLGIDYDEGPSQAELAAVGEPCELAPAESGRCAPYIQSLRTSRYKEVAEELLLKGAAYRCDCTPERLAAEREEQIARKETPGYSGHCRDRNVSADTKHVVRFKLPASIDLSVLDAVRGLIHWDNPSLRDTVLLKSDGMPTYHLACVVDDHDMEISHVLRGEEWISTTPVHVLLYDALGWEKPKFCHLSHILGNDGKKLSKRHGAEALEAFKEGGYLPDALINFIARIGWSLGDGEEQEIFSREELISKFSLDRLSKAGGVYDQDKLLWTNGVYIREMDTTAFTLAITPYFKQAGLPAPSGTGWELLVPHVQERCKVLPDALAVASFLFVDTLTISAEDLISKKVPREIATRVLEAVAVNLRELTLFKAETIEILLKGIAESLELKPGQVFPVVRIAITGSMATPPLFESIEAVGQERALERLEAARLLLAD